MTMISNTSNTFTVSTTWDNGYYPNPYPYPQPYIPPITYISYYPPVVWVQPWQQLCNHCYCAIGSVKNDVRHKRCCKCADEIADDGGGTLVAAIVPEPPDDRPEGAVVVI